VCVRLYPRAVASDNTLMPLADLPEMHTIPLESLVMQALAMRPGEHPGRFFAAALDPPPAAAVAAAVARLRGIGAVVDCTGKNSVVTGGRAGGSHHRQTGRGGGGGGRRRIGADTSGIPLVAPPGGASVG